METDLSKKLPTNDVTFIGFLDAKEQFQKNTNWWSVLASFDLADFNPSPRWIANKTGISSDEVLEALDGLVLLGYLQKDRNAIYPVKGISRAEFDYTSSTPAQIIDQHTLVSQQMLNDLAVTKRGAYNHCFFAGNSEILNDLYKDISAAFDKAQKRSIETASSNTSIFKVTFTAANVISAPTKKEGGN